MDGFIARVYLVGIVLLIGYLVLRIGFLVHYFVHRICSYRGRGRRHLRKGNLEHAIALLTKAIAKNPCDAFAYDARGNAFGRQDRYAEALGRPEQAIADFRRALTLDPRPLLRTEAQEALKRLGAEP
jgi:tetratricopeptide (TPR) repeat protein